jgi:hypothetical protein
VYDRLEEKLRAGLYGSEEEAVAVLSERKRRKDRVPLDLLDEDAPPPEPPGAGTGKQAE